MRIMSVIWSNPHRDYVSTSKEWLYAPWILPAHRKAIQTLRGPAINPETNSALMMPTLSIGSVHSHNRAPKNPSWGCELLLVDCFGWSLQLAFFKREAVLVSPFYNIVKCIVWRLVCGNKHVTLASGNLWLPFSTNCSYLNHHKS